MRAQAKISDVNNTKRKKNNYICCNGFRRGQHPSMEFISSHFSLIFHSIQMSKTFCPYCRFCLPLSCRFVDAHECLLRRIWLCVLDTFYVYVCDVYMYRATYVHFFFIRVLLLFLCAFLRISFELTNVGFNYDWALQTKCTAPRKCKQLK